MDLEQVVFYLAIATSTLFVVQFIMSFFVDFDADVDFDTSMDVSDFISFKGGLHFLLGFSWMGVLNGVGSVKEVLIAVAVGIAFVVILAFVYKKVYSLAEEKTFQDPHDLVGTECELITYYNGTGTVSINFDGRRSQMNVKGTPTMKKGDLVKVVDYKEGFLIVENK
ncbi:MAG: hypothetical protein MJZ33_12555 [Paludibacteraceae bacterium]|nr:hypothetical protein [Paludibacteraceae bacterium]